MSDRQILTFRMEGQRFGLPIADVKEVLRAVEVTPLPGAPEVVAGLIDLRGTLTPVLNLAVRLGLPRRGVAPDDHFIVTGSAETPLVMWVESAESVAELPASGVEGPPRGTADHIAGVVRYPDGLVMIEDVVRFLAPAEEAALKEALQLRRTSTAAE